MSIPFLNYIFFLWLKYCELAIWKKKLMKSPSEIHVKCAN